MIIKNKNIKNDTRNLKDIFESIIRINLKKETGNFISINLFSPENLEFIILLTTSIISGGKKKKRKSKKRRKKKKTKKRKRKKGGNGKTRRRRRIPRNISQRSSSQLTTTRSNNSFDILEFIRKLLIGCFVSFIFYNAVNWLTPTYRPLLNQSTNIVPSSNWTNGVINPELFPVLNPNINITFEGLTQSQVKKLIVSKSGKITSMPLNLSNLGDTLYAEINLVSKENSPTDVGLKEFNKLPFKERSSLHSATYSASGYTAIFKWNLNDEVYNIRKIEFNRNLDRRIIAFPEQYNELLVNIAKQHLDAMKQTNTLEEDENSGSIQINFVDLPTNVLTQFFQSGEQQAFHRDGNSIVNPKLNLTTPLVGIRQTNYLRNQTKILRPDQFSYPLSITYTSETEYTANVRVHPISGETKQINEDSSQTFVTTPGTSYTNILSQDKGTEHGAVFLPQGRPLKNPRRLLFISVLSDKYYELNELLENEQ